MKIDSENIDELYDKINSLIDKYFEYDISPKSLARYLSKGSIGLSRFINRNELSEIEKIEKIIIDVVEDRIADSEKKIMKFESHKIINENNTLYNTVFDIPKEIIKILSDRYKVPYSLVENLDDNTFSVKGFVKTHIVKVLKSADILNVLEQEANKMYDKLVNLTLDSKYLDLSISLKDKINKESFLEKTIDDLSVKKYEIVEEILSTDNNELYKMVGRSGDYFFFEPRG